MDGMIITAIGSAIIGGITGVAALYQSIATTRAAKIKAASDDESRRDDRADRAFKSQMDIMEKMFGTRIGELEAEIEESKKERAELKADNLRLDAAHRECEKSHQENAARITVLERDLFNVNRRADDCEKERAELWAELDKRGC